MADSVTNAFEIERRGIMWSPLITLNDGVTSLGYDGDPNNVIDGNTPGESWLYSLPTGQFYKQSDATLWWKSEAPNTWINLEGGGGGEVAPPYILNFVEADWVVDGTGYKISILSSQHGKGDNKYLTVFGYKTDSTNESILIEYTIGNTGNIEIFSDSVFDGYFIISNLAMAGSTVTSAELDGGSAISVYVISQILDSGGA